MQEHEKILEYLKSEKGSKSLKEIISGISGSLKKKKETKKILEELEKNGKILRKNNGKYTHIENTNYFIGTLDVVQERFGFVENEKESVFIPGNKLNTGFSGDIVVAKVMEKGNNSKKREGEIVRVVERKRKEIFGILYDKGNFGFVEPLEKFGKDIYISKKYVKPGLDKKLVVVEIYDWGNNDKKPEGRIINELGDPNDSNTLIESVILKNGYSNSFPKNVISEAKNIEKDIHTQDRKDLTDLTIITIDGDDAKDLDDAVYIEKIGKDSYRLLVSIADVSYFVNEDSELDKEASQRANSVYLVDRVLPMFPKELSNDLCSLNPNESKMTFSVDMKIDKNGNVYDFEIFESIIKSKYRMTYKNVNEILDGKNSDYPEIEEMIFQMQELAQILREKRFERGSIDFDIPEIKVKLDNNKKVQYIEKRERGDSEKIIEEFMIKTNETVAEKMFWLDIPFLYRTHEKPDIEKIKFLNEIISKFGYSIKNIEHIHPGKFQKILDRVSDDDNKMLIHKLMLMSMKQAKYTKENIGHFGLSSHYYTHFTSPIRRYADLLVHRILKSTLKKLPDKKTQKSLEKTVDKSAPHISSMERQAMKAEDETIKIKIVEYMMDKVGQNFKAKITGFSNSKMFLQLSNYAETFIRINSMQSDIAFNENQYIMVDNSNKIVYNVGDLLDVMIVRVNLFDLAIESIIYKNEEI